MPTFSAQRVLAFTSIFAVACSEGDAPGEKIEIQVAPLRLPGVEDACYRLEVLDESSKSVWSQSPICADQYGDNASAITYVGTCDASDLNGDEVSAATVVLTILDLYEADGADVGTALDVLSDWKNPCAAPYSPNGCRITTTCEENADTSVVFDLTVMREANQGFFDVAVNFEDIFCSAKVDCVYPATAADPARPIELVFDPVTGERVQTVVWAFACTDGDPAGEIGASTHLYMDDVVLVCGGVRYPVSASAGPGNVYPAGVGAPAPLVQAMVFEGRETIHNGPLDADKRYWSVALGLRDGFFHPSNGTAPSCTLETQATASRGPLASGVTPGGTNYPFIRVSVPINDGNRLVCTQHGLDDATPHQGVATAYTGTRPDGSGFATTTFGHVGAPTADSLVTSPIGVLVDECGATTSPCDPHATCTDLTVGFACACAAGYSGNGLVCDDSDGCASVPCFEGVVCSDVAAPNVGYTCGECPVGMSGDGEECEEIDGCLGEVCDPRAGCTDLLAPEVGYVCGQCPSGTTGNGEVCAEVDGCDGEPCFDGVDCQDVASPGEGYTCGACPSGTSGDGEHCEEVDGCAGEPCFEGVACGDRPAPGVGYDCGACPVGMSGDGEACAETDACVHYPCGDLAECEDIVGGSDGVDGRECMCAAGFELDGDDCVDIDECLCADPTRYGLVEDFSPSANPNGTWQYGWKPTLSGAFGLLTRDGEPSQYFWVGPNGRFAGPVIWRNEGSLPAYGVQPGQVSFHPGCDGSLAVLRWTAPMDFASCSISATWSQGDSGNTAAWLFLGTTELTNASTTSGGGDFSTLRPIGLGQTIDLLVGMGADGCGGDNTPVTLRVECGSCAIQCGSNEVCVNGPGAGRCECEPGYVFDGPSCVDVDACDANPCGDHATCADVAAPAPNDATGRTCTCRPGYGGFVDGEGCSEIDACVAFACGDLAECEDIVGGSADAAGRECLCDDGFELDGDDCVDVDECADVVSPCEHPSVCTNEPGTYRCGCPEGTVDDGADGCESVLDGYAYVPAGTFTMGSPIDEVGRGTDESQHVVTLTRAFWMKQTEVTQGEWLAVMGNNPSSRVGDLQRPVEQVTWWDALAFANALSANAGLPSCYALTDCSGIPGSSYVCSDASLAVGCNGYRLPTEAEWEYAARAGDAASRYGFVDDIAWNSANSGGSTHAVATALPNAWGLHDVLGNVWEWTWDRYGGYPGQATDPTGPMTGATRAFRGGSLGDPADNMRYAERAATNPTHRGASHGIRLVRTIGCPEGTALDDSGMCTSTLAGYAYIPNGTFAMGSPTNEAGRGADEVQHQVTLTRPFWMKQTEVTQAEWRALIGNNPSTFQPPAHATTGAHPVEQVSWWDAVAYANALSTSEGLPSCYTLSGCTGAAGAPGYQCASATFVGLACKGYRLPTEAEWEYAARAGTTSARYREPIGDSAWYASNASGRTQPIAMKAPNVWGLYDMLGNVLEWTHDWYAAYVGNAVDPTGPSTGSVRGFRGGSWYHAQNNARSADRDGDAPSYVDNDNGFRLVRTVGCPDWSELNDDGGCDPIAAEPVSWGSVPTNVEPATGIVAVAAGSDHTVALRGDGTVVAWGSNGYGQTVVPRGLDNVVAIAAGSNHTVALKGDGTVVAWGDNGYGQTTAPSGLANVVAIAAGSYHSVALKGDGTVVAWGDNTHGQTTVPSGLSNVVAIAAGGAHTVALKGDGTLVAWGYNGQGQTAIPSGLANVIAIAAGGVHTVALKGDGTLVAWGYNRQGETTIPNGLANVVDIAAGGGHTLALKGDGTLVAWGNNGQGQTTVPSGLVNVVAIAAAISHTVALKSDGTVIAWGGDNRYGQTTVPSGLVNVVAIAVGDFHTVALKTDGTVIAWGDNYFRQASVPSGLVNVTAVAAGRSHTVVLKADGTVVAWGNNDGGQALIPSGLGNVIAVAAGGNHTVALKGDGTVVAWGGNYGQASVGYADVIAIAAGQSQTVALKADGTVVAWWSTVPSGLARVIAIAAGADHAVALKADGTVVAWGYNGHGQTTVPSGLTNVVAIAAGQSHTVALKADGTVVGWGSNGNTQTTVPSGLGNVIAIAAGGNNTSVLKRVTYAPAPTIVGFAPNGATVGQTITVTGTAFERVVAVRVGGAITRWTVNSPTSITLTVPDNAQSSTIEVVTMSGAAMSP